MKHFFPQLEKIAIDSTISHFLLMFGYKLFSAYFSLFLIERGLSIAKVGYTYLLIYMAIVISAPFVGVLIYRFNPAVLSSLGILGYAVYSFGMIYSSGAMFNVMQVVLGASAALFFVSSRAILIRSRLNNYNLAYGWFYSAPIYADFFATLVGALLIWQFGFTGVFIVSLVVHIITIVFNFHFLFEASAIPQRVVAFGNIVRNYVNVFSGLKKINAWPIIFSSLSIIIAFGIYHAFFALFLKNSGFSQEAILLYISIFSFIFIPLSGMVVKLLRRINSRPLRIIIVAGGICALSYFLIGLLGIKLGFVGFLGVNLIGSMAGLLINSLRSGIISKNFPDNSEEAGVIDTIFSSLGISIGSLMGGILVTKFGYSFTFMLTGFFILAVVLISSFAYKRRAREMGIADSLSN